MNKYIKIFSLAVLFSFIWGAWWGFYSYEKNLPANRQGPLVNVLALKGVFPEQFIRDFESKNKLRIAVNEMSSEAELLREALSHNENYDLIVINSFVAKSFLIDNVFDSLDQKKITNSKDVSIDFKNLDYDLDNRFLLPITWGLNGFVINAKEISLSSESLTEIVPPLSKVAFLSSPIELFHISTKLKPIIKTWVETGQIAELKTTLKELKPIITQWRNLTVKDLLEGRLQVLQLSNGEAANLVGPGSHFRYILPKERATLWINLIGVSLGAKDSSFAHHVLNLLLQTDNNLHLVELNHQASVLESSNNSKLPLLQQAQFIRKVPLSRVELFINREATEPIWNQAIQSEWGFQ